MRLRVHISMVTEDSLMQDGSVKAQLLKIDSFRFIIFLRLMRIILAVYLL